MEGAINKLEGKGYKESEIVMSLLDDDLPKAKQMQ